MLYETTAIRALIPTQCAAFHVACLKKSIWSCAHLQVLHEPCSHRNENKNTKRRLRPVKLTRTKPVFLYIGLYFVIKKGHRQYLGSSRLWKNCRNKYFVSFQHCAALICSTPEGTAQTESNRKVKLCHQGREPRPLLTEQGRKRSLWLAEVLFLKQFVKPTSYLPSSGQGPGTS